MAAYFLALNKAKSNKTGNDFFTCTICAMNSYGRWAGSDHFISAQLYEKIQKLGIIPGYAVILRFTGDGKLSGIAPDDSVAPLELVPDDE